MYRKIYRIGQHFNHWRFQFKNRYSSRLYSKLFKIIFKTIACLLKSTIIFQRLCVICPILNLDQDVRLTRKLIYLADGLLVSVNHHIIELLMADTSSTLMRVLPIVGQMDDQLSTYFLQIHSNIYCSLTLAI